MLYKILGGLIMKIYTLENKNEILAILTHNDNMSYRDFKTYAKKLQKVQRTTFTV